MCPVVYAYMQNGSRCSRREESMGSGAEEEMVLNCSLNRFVKMEVIPGRGDVWAKV